MQTHRHIRPMESGHLITHLAAAAGSYLPNQAIIKLSRDVSLFADGGASAIVKYAVFIHEYLHYLHNYSTIAGVYDFLGFLGSLNLFVTTVDVGGQSHGANALTVEDRVTYAAFVTLRKHLAGDVTAPFDARLHKTDVRLALADIVSSQSEIELWNRRVELRHVDIQCRVSSASAPQQTVSVRLGSYILMESIAWEIEQLLYVTGGIDPRTVEPPMFPYRTGRVIFEEVSGRILSSQMMAKVLLIALQTSDPGDSFVMIARQFKLSTSEDSDAAILQRITNDLLSLVSANIEAICEHMISSVASGWQERGSAGRGITAMAGWCKDLLRKRQKQPFFELDAVSLTSEFDVFMQLIRAYPPCPIVQSPGEKDGEVDVVVPPNSTVDPNDLGAAQGLFQFANSHFAPAEIVATAQAKKGACRFWGACKVGFALTSGEACQQRPWESFQSDCNGGCWYSEGMLAGRGRPDLP
jgi:hypothetical protein